jgi:hypothetical protein
VNPQVRKMSEIGSGTILTLRSGALRLELSPSIGGAISAFEWIESNSSRPILRKSHSGLEKVLNAASFPLVSCVNRIRGAPEDQWAELGMRVLEPGAEMSLAMRLDVIPKKRPFRLKLRNCPYIARSSCKGPHSETWVSG